MVKIRRALPSDAKDVKSAHYKAPDKNMNLYKPWKFDIPIVRMEKDL